MKPVTAYQLATEELNLHKSNLVSASEGVHGLEIESGAFTPVFLPENGEFENINYITGSQRGSYYKVGKSVFITVILGKRDTLLFGTASGALRIGGLPFLASESCSLAVGRADRFEATTVDRPIRAHIYIDSSYINLYKNKNDVTLSPVVVGDLSPTSYTFINLSGTYTID